ncbi:hypothetical protein BDF20DRAFT_859714 [Mycotypha africana]|uniref:uncharacterized protein n=1 Tax=Mycotypha africana TaxID=64632 RepID=UPI002300B42A|nr:uncharacterized protein BDF20DRAFT_859714 [Mycotypha africana]KAI8984381.1 hypothetical protein BDF20DRAFT_859714 [Mycotypha africana]
MFSVSQVLVLLLSTSKLVSYVIANEPIVIEKGECDLATDDIRCRYACGPEQLQPMCITGRCYCTNVGLGSCRTGNNNEGCIAVCQFMGKNSNGCSENGCACA